MKIGKVGLLTRDVRRLANFYQQLLEVDNGSDDAAHQFILSEETMLTVCYDGEAAGGQNQHICLAFTVEDIDQEYERVRAMGVPIVEPPTRCPWGAVNMSFRDPDGNMIYFRSFPQD